MPAIAVYLCLYQWSLIKVLAFLLIFIDPQLREHLGYLQRHESTEYGITCILGGCREDGHIQVLVDIEHITDLLRQDTPLIVTEVVDNNKEDFVPSVNGRKDLGLEDFRGNKRSVVSLLFYPIEIMLLYELSEAVVSLFLLHSQHLHHTAVGTGKFELPSNKFLIYLLPVVKGTAITYLYRYLLVLLLIAGLRHLGNDFLLMYILLQCKQNLTGVYRLYKVVGNLRANGLVHDILLLTLRNHHHRCRRLYLLYLLKGLQSRQAWHLLVEKDEVECLLTTLIYRVRSIADGNHLITFLLQKDYMCLEKFYLVIDPK